MKILLVIAMPLLNFTASAVAGIYDPEILVIRERFGAYIAQSEKNIAALTKLVGAYDRVNDSMAKVVQAKKSLTTTRCPRETKEKLLACLSKQRTAISILDLYTRAGAELMPQAITDALEAGRTLNQDVSTHIRKFEKTDAGFRTWRTKTLPALKLMADRDRDALAQMYGTQFEADYRATAILEESRHEAALLAQELTQAAVRLREQGMRWLDEHRVAHARLTAASMQWLEGQIPTMWTALEPTVQKEPSVEGLKSKVTSTLSEQRKLLIAEIEKRNEATERTAGIELLRKRVDESLLPDSDRKVFEGLFKEIRALSTNPKKAAFADVLLERGYIWLEAMVK